MRFPLECTGSSQPCFQATATDSFHLDLTLTRTLQSRVEPWTPTDIHSRRGYEPYASPKKRILRRVLKAMFGTLHLVSLTKPA